MYFGAEVDGSHHLWRQRFSTGQPEQITSGPTEEDGLAVAPDGRFLITSIGLQESAVWIHDDRGDRPLSSEGHVAPLGSLSQVTNNMAHSSARFSSDGRFLFYLMRRDSPASPSELWRSNLASATSEALFRGMSLADYDVSSDGKEVVFSTQPSGKASQVWLAHLEGSSPPKLITSTGERVPLFGPDGLVFFQFTDGKANFIGQIRKDGSDRSKVVPYPIFDLYTISPDGRWLVAHVQTCTDMYRMVTLPWRFRWEGVQRGASVAVLVLSHGLLTGGSCTLGLRRVHRQLAARRWRFPYRRERRSPTCQPREFKRWMLKPPSPALV